MVEKSALNINFKRKLGFTSNRDFNTFNRSKPSSDVIPAKNTITTTKIIHPTGKENLSEFLMTTTFHGLRFVGDQTISYFERFLFLTSFVIAFAVALYFIFDVYDKWDKSPIIVGISPFAVSVTQIPFPAITLCNINQILKSKANNFSSDIVKSTIASELCNQENDIDLKTLSTLNMTNSISNFEDFILQFSQPCHKMILSCSFGGMKQNCSAIFQPILTDEGLCCTFNKLHPQYFYLNADFKLSNTFSEDGATPVKWTSTSGYQKLLPKKYYPRSTVGIGVSNGLTVILDADIDEYFCSTTHGAGFKISIHSPSEMPNAKETGILVGTGMECRMRLDVKITEATNAVRAINQKYRQCLFEEESPLLSYAVYSKKNCNLECDAKRLYKKCGCIDYYMPRLYANASNCGLKDVFCTDNVTSIHIDPNNAIDMEYLQCYGMCLPGCFDYTYKGDMFVSPILTGDYKVKNKFIEEMDQQHARRSISILNFFFAENAFHPDTKDEYIGMTQFLSYTGGLMGLFLGFSTISIIEILYFCTLRPYCARYRYRKEQNKVGTMDTKHKETQKELIINFNNDNMLDFYDHFKAIKSNNKISYH